VSAIVDKYPGTADLCVFRRRRCGHPLLVTAQRIERTVQMPKTTKQGKPKKEELPSTIRKSDAKAQRTFAKTHDSAAEEYGEGERAHRTAYAALKHSYEKVGDHWEPKDQRGPSDARARSGGPDATGATAEGVDANASKKHLQEIARRLDIRGRSTMSKDDLVDAIQKANRRETRNG
jgi:cation transport regulator ChaB